MTFRSSLLVGQLNQSLVRHFGDELKIPDQAWVLVLLSGATIAFQSFAIPLLPSVLRK